MTTPEKRLVVIVKGNQEGIFGRVVQDLSGLPKKKKTNNGMVEIQYSDTRKAWYWASALGDGSAHEQAFKVAQEAGKLYRLKVETSSSDDESEVSPPATQPRPRSTRAAQRVEAPAPAVEPEPEDLEALRHVDLTNLVTARESKKWAAKQKKKYDSKDNSSAALCTLLRDQAADPSQWAIVAQHEAPAPKYVEETVSESLTRGVLDADTWKKWLEGLTVGPRREAFESPKEDARCSIMHTLPTLKKAKQAGSLREALAERLERPATANDVKEAFLDAADELREAWGERKMVPDGYDGVTVEDLRSRLEATEARAMRRARHELGELSEERRLELGCNDMYYTCALTCEHWSRDLALALGDGVADYAKKAAQFKQDQHGNIGSIRDVSAAVAARIRNGRRGLLFDEKSRSEIRNHTLPMRRARKTVHRAAVTSSHLMTWGY